jgi:hypothetical protein
VLGALRRWEGHSYICRGLGSRRLRRCAPVTVLFDAVGYRTLSVALVLDGDLLMLSG